MEPREGGIRTVTSGPVSDQEAHELWPLYDEVFNDKEDEAQWRETWDLHSGRTGFRCVRAFDGRGLVGFAYGYTGEHGQWFTDHASEALTPAIAAEWLGGHFELVSIGVAARLRGRGVGRRLLDEVCRGLTQDRWVLMTTADEEDPARRLYASAGWAVLGPGIGEGTVILGRHR